MRRISNTILVLIFGVLLTTQNLFSQTSQTQWPVASSTSKPWTYWWWHGSAVDSTQITNLMNSYQSVGLGGLHIVPIYGVKNNSANNIQFLSPTWRDRMVDSVVSGQTRGIGIDMTPGTGWMWGGPSVTTEYSSRRTGGSEGFKIFNVSGGTVLNFNSGTAQIEAISGKNLTTQVVFDLKNNVIGNSIQWAAPVGAQFKVYILLSRPTMTQVKRAAPGSEGLMIDPFSTTAFDQYWSQFETFFDSVPVQSRPRALYHDSWEYYADNNQNGTANITSQFAMHFELKRGYPLYKVLPELMADSSDAIKSKKVLNDYRLTLADLHYDFISRYNTKAHEKGLLTRDQAHGSPANMLDLYGLVDIPDTEQYRGGKPDGTDPLMLRFATSAANVMGRKLIAAESATWLGEHFKVTPAEIKKEMDSILVRGINHLTYHGIAYSPQNEPWPGRLFYAETNFGSSNTFWRNFADFNAYITRIQSVLQEGESANDFLLFYPLQDIGFDKTTSLTLNLGAHNLQQSIGNTFFYKLMKELDEAGYNFDLISDRQIQLLTSSAGQITAPGKKYKTILIPRAQTITASTFQKLKSLAQQGSKILFVGPIPKMSSTLSDDSALLNSTVSALVFSTLANSPSLTHSLLGNGELITSESAIDLLKYAGVEREYFQDNNSGLRFTKRKTAAGIQYLVVNTSNQIFDKTIEIPVQAKTVVFMDPQFNTKIGQATSSTEQGRTKFRLRLQSGESIIIRALTATINSVPNWGYTGKKDNNFPQFRLDQDSYNFSCSTEYSGQPGQDRTCQRIFDQSGMIGSEFHSTSPYAKMWLSSGKSINDQYVKIDFKKVCDLQNVKIWNYNERTSTGLDLSNRGINSAEFKISNDDEVYTSIGTYQFSKAPSSQSVNFAQSIAFTNARARYLLLKVNSNWGDKEFVGLSELIPTVTNCENSTNEEILKVSEVKCSSTYSASNTSISGMDRSCNRIIDTSGFSGIQGFHSTSPYGTMWLSSGSNTSQQIDFSLNKMCHLQSLKVWNYNERTQKGNSLSGRGVKKAEIETSRDGIKFSSLGEFIFNQAPSEGNVDFSQSINLQNTEARFLRLKILSKWDNSTNDPYLGLSEIQIKGANCENIDEINLENSWQVSFVDGGPTLPAARVVNQLKSWTTMGEFNLAYFSGTAKYETQIAWDTQLNDSNLRWILDLGDVRHMAKVFVNGKYVGTLFSAPYKIDISTELKAGMNIISIEVTNLPTNRIIKMDIDNIIWKKFENVNYISFDGLPFNAAQWSLDQSGLLGPVRVVGFQIENK